MQKLAREIAFHSFVKRMTILVSMLFVLISIASPQQTIAQDDGNSAVHGKGTPNHMAKFKGRNSLQNTAILESNGCVSELPTFNGAEAGFLCLHDFAGSGATINAISSIPDRVTFVGENDSPTGDPDPGRTSR